MGEREGSVCALLDDCSATPERPSSRLYTDFVREHRCTDPATLRDVWTRVEADQRTGLHALLLIDYEWGARLLGAGDERVDDAAALRVLMFRELALLSNREADAWLRARTGGELGPADAGVMRLRSSVDETGFADAVGRIHEVIRAGETYQVNYTYRLQGEAWGAPAALYRRLRARQPVAFGAYIALPPEGDAGAPPHVLSCSPELFLRHADGLVTTKPMKGTAARAGTSEGDRETARRLAADAKNRAENLMIVDLLRNDLGRVAVPGTVRVPELFAVEPYATVFQMTSTVQARLRPGVDLPALLRATYPCGSITGAPKHRTMQLIAGLEGTPRGLYCGAIGWVDAPVGEARIGELCLSVAIRTVTMGASSGGLRPVSLGVGAGVVIDSEAAAEYRECRLKGRFLTELEPGFELFETLRREPVRGLLNLDRHLARLAHSADVLGFAFDRARVEKALDAASDGIESAEPWRVRVALDRDGDVRVAQAPLAPLVPAADGTVGLLVAEHRLPDEDPLAAHKTTRRGHYDAGIRAAEAAGAFDSLFFTGDGRLAEGGRSNVFVRLDGRWWTPPVADGALPGVMRGLLLEDPEWAARERTLTLQDLRRAESIVVCNALRGVLRARVLDRVGTD